MRLLIRISNKSATELDPVLDHVSTQHALVLAELNSTERLVRGPGHERGEVDNSGAPSAEELPERGDNSTGG